MTSLLNIAGNIPVVAEAGGQSLRFEDGDSAYLSWTPASAGNQKTWTWSGWFKTTTNAVDNTFIDAFVDANNECVFRTNSNQLSFIMWDSGAYKVVATTAAVFRDPSAWYHIVLAVDTTQATNSDGVKIWVNGVQQTLSFSYYTQNNDGRVNAAVIHRIGLSAISGSNRYTDGYLANVCFIDGTALDPTSFGEYQDTLWRPKSDADITGNLTFGTNGFYLPFAEDIDAGSSYYFDGSSDYVSYSSASLYDVGSSDDFELECFFNTDMVSGSGDYGYMLGNYDGSSQFMTLQPDFRSANEHFAWYIGNGQAWIWDYTSGDVSPNTWHHLTISRTSGTLRMFLDGVRLTSITSASASNGSISGGNVINNTTSYNLSSFRIGQAYAGQKAYDGYVSNVRFIVGSSIRNSDSNFTPPTSTLTDVTNTKLLTATNLTIGDDISSNNNDGSGSGNTRSSGVNPFGTYNFFQDVSGNDNHFAPNNLQYTDVVLDSPVTGGNFATLNPVDKNLATGSFSEGNLKTAGGGSNSWARASIPFPTTGKWYAEFMPLSSLTSTFWIGLSATDTSGNYLIYVTDGINGEIQSEAGTISTGNATYTSGDIIGVAVDRDNDTVSFYYNNTLQYTATSYDATNLVFAVFVASSYVCAANFGQDSSFAGNETPQGNTDDNGQGDFYYAPPSGYLALTTGNLPTPDITAPDDYFNTVLYTGNGSSQSITGVGFQPSWLWIKSRSAATDHFLQDEVRGAGKTLISNGTSSENTNWTGLSFDSDGFTVDTAYSSEMNTSSATYVAWGWLAGGTAVSNTDGSITSQVSANTDAGFSVATFTSASGTNSVGHGLGLKPKLVIQKRRDSTSSWYAYYDFVDGSLDYLTLDTTAASATWGGTAATSSVFYENWSAGASIVAYSFAEVEGYSKIGSYTGNGSTDGTFVHCGFRPAWILVKSTSGSTQWMIYDNKREGYNVDNDALTADDSSAEKTDNDVDFLSNGFKWRRSSPNFNQSTYIFYAVAEAPFKSANAR